MSPNEREVMRQIGKPEVGLASLHEISTGEGKVRITTLAGTDAIDKDGITKAVLESVDFDKAEPRESASGRNYMTTRANSWNVEDGKYRYQISMSVNRYPLGESGATKPALTKRDLRLLQRVTDKVRNRNPELADTLEIVAERAA